jgi:hypothetical protein
MDIILYDIPWDHGVIGHAEMVLGLMDVRVADPTIQHLYHHILCPCAPAFKKFQQFIKELSKRSAH